MHSSDRGYPLRREYLAKITASRWRRLAADLTEAAQRLDAGDSSVGDQLFRPLALELVLRGVRDARMVALPDEFWDAVKRGSD